MAWPFDARLQTFVGMTKIVASFLNGLQDAIVDIVRLGLHGERRIFVPPVGGGVLVPSTGMLPGNPPQFRAEEATGARGGWRWQTTEAPHSIAYQCPARTGDRIVKAVAFGLLPLPSLNPVTLKLFLEDTSVAEVTIPPTGSGGTWPPEGVEVAPPAPVPIYELPARVQLVIETAAQTRRKVAVAGRSMEENIAIAESLGYIHFPPDTRTTLDQIASLPDDQVCVLATGSQGEPNAALARMALGRYRQVHIKEGDTVVLSSKAIPGNETQIYHNIDNLFRQGANVVYGEAAGIHVSGHAAQEELKLMLNLLRPLYFVPLHGEYRMLRVHANLAEELGFAAEDIFVLDKGHRLILDDNGARLGEGVTVEDVFVDGSLVGDVGSTILRDRKALSQDGFVIARVSMSAANGHENEEPQIISQGFVYMPESAELMQSAQSAILEIVRRYSPETEDPEEIGARIKHRLQQLFFDETGRRPIIVPMVTAA